jgi:predicted nucleic-acid-binding protein
VIAIDTNILVRFLTQDDEEQFNRSLKLFQEHLLFIPDSVWLETEWVLRFSYRFTMPQIASALTKVLSLSNVHVTDSNKMIQILQWYQGELDFADAFHLANSQTIPELVTFDSRFIKRAKKLTSCLVREPQITSVGCVRRVLLRRHPPYGE